MGLKEPLRGWDGPVDETGIERLGQVNGNSSCVQFRSVYGIRSLINYDHNSALPTKISPFSLDVLVAFVYQAMIMTRKDDDDDDGTANAHTLSCNSDKTGGNSVV